MEPLNIESGRNSPLIRFITEENKLLIQGVSTMPDPRSFYRVVLDWLDDYKDEIHPTCAFDFYLPYFNSGSNKSLFNVMEKLHSHMQAGKKYVISWYVEEDDEFMTESGQAMEEMLGIRFNYKEVPFNPERLF